MELAAQDFGVELWEHVANVITAMRRIAPELGLVGTSRRRKEPAGHPGPAESRRRTHGQEHFELG